MSPLLFYILNVIKNDMSSQPHAYGGFDLPMNYFMRASQCHRNILADEPIPWSYS